MMWEGLVGRLVKRRVLLYEDEDVMGARGRIYIASNKGYRKE
jgi:hypothetical protein